MKVLGILAVLAFFGDSAQAEIPPHQRLGTKETLSVYSQVFKSTFASASLKKLTALSTPTYPKTALVDLTKLSLPELIARVPVSLDYPNQGELVHKLFIREQTAFVIGGLNSKIITGQPLSPEERELLTRILTY